MQRPIAAAGLLLPAHLSLEFLEAVSSRLSQSLWCQIQQKAVPLDVRYASHRLCYRYSFGVFRLTPSLCGCMFYHSNRYSTGGVLNYDDWNYLQVEATVICTASGPWGLVSTIEGIMVDQSVASVGVYLKFCKTRCHDKLADKVCPQALQDQTETESIHDITHLVNELYWMSGA